MRYTIAHAPQVPPRQPITRIISWPVYHNAWMTVIPSGTRCFFPITSTVTKRGMTPVSWG